MSRRSQLTIIGALVVCAVLWTASGLKIGAFNVETLGQSKLNDQLSKETLIKIVQRYDVLLIQEVRDKEGTVIPKLVYLVNNHIKQNLYNFQISQRLGRSSSKEQYAFIYRSDKVTIGPISPYQYPVDLNQFERPPFGVLVSPTIEDIEAFFLLGIHVKPADAYKEINDLLQVFSAASKHFGTERGIILGDFNAGCRYLSAEKYKLLLPKYKNFMWLLNRNMNTNIINTCPYDQIVVHQSLLRFVVKNSAAVFRFDGEYGLTKQQAKRVSNHYPVEVEL